MIYKYQYIHHDISYTVSRSYHGMAFIICDVSIHNAIHDTATISRKDKDADIVATVGGMDFTLNSSTVIPTDEKTGCLACFFLVACTQVADEANMEIIWHKDGDVKVPLLRNSKVLNPDDKLLRYLPKKQVATEALAFSPAKRRRQKG